MHLRLSDQQVNELTDEFHEWKNMGMASIAKSKQKICTFLHYLASGGYYRQVGYAMVIAKSTTVATVHEVADFLMAIAPRIYLYPSRQSMKNFQVTLLMLMPSLEYRGLTMLVMPTFVVGMEKAAIR